MNCAKTVSIPLTYILLFNEPIKFLNLLFLMILDDFKLFLGDFNLSYVVLDGFMLF